MTPDQQEPQAPQPTPEPTPTPPLTPNPSNIPQPVPTLNPTASFNPYATPPASKPNKGLLIGLIAGGIALVAVIVLLVLALTVWGKEDDKDTSKTTTSQDSSKDEEEKDTEGNNSNNNAIAATSIGSYEAVCEGGSVTNSAAYDKTAQSKIASFYQSRTLARSDSDANWTSTSVGYGDPYYADSKSFETVSVVACLSYVSGSEQKELDCDYTSSGATVTVAYYSSKFKLTFYEAKTGKKIKDRIGGFTGRHQQCQ